MCDVVLSGVIRCAIKARGGEVALGPKLNVENTHVRTPRKSGALPSKVASESGVVRVTAAMGLGLTML